MPRNPALVAEALRQLNALVGGKLPTIGSDDPVQPVMIVQDLSRTLAVEPWEVRGLFGFGFITSSTDHAYTLLPIGGFGLVVERIRYRFWATGGGQPTLSVFRGGVIGTEVTGNTVPTGGAEPRAKFFHTVSPPINPDGAIIPFANQSEGTSTFQALVEFPTRWFVPAGANLSLQWENVGGGVWSHQLQLEWREIPDL